MKWNNWLGKVYPYLMEGCRKTTSMNVFGRQCSDIHLHNFYLSPKGKICIFPEKFKKKKLNSLALCARTLSDQIFSAIGTER